MVEFHPCVATPFGSSCSWNRIPLDHAHFSPLAPLRASEAEFNVHFAVATILEENPST
jgi:hypothetical protein